MPEYDLPTNLLQTFNHSFIHSFNEYLIFTESLISARHSGKGWLYKGKIERDVLGFMNKT